MVKYLNEDELNKVRDEERREYFRYMNKLRKHQKNMMIAFTVTLILCVLAVSSFFLYIHYNNQTLVLVINSSSNNEVDEVSKKILINNFSKLKYDKNGEFKINMSDIYNSTYGFKIDKQYKNKILCDGYILITKEEKDYKIDATNYCKK